MRIGIRKVDHIALNGYSTKAAPENVSEDDRWSVNLYYFFL